jgi:hypothetical protein
MHVRVLVVAKNIPNATQGLFQKDPDIVQSEPGASGVYTAEYISQILLQLYCNVWERICDDGKFFCKPYICQFSCSIVWEKLGL